MGLSWIRHALHSRNLSSKRRRKEERCGASWAQERAVVKLRTGYGVWLEAQYLSRLDDPQRFAGEGPKWGVVVTGCCRGDNPNQDDLLWQLRDPSSDAAEARKSFSVLQQQRHIACPLQP